MSFKDKQILLLLLIFFLLLLTHLLDLANKNTEYLVKFKGQRNNEEYFSISMPQISMAPSNIWDTLILISYLLLI